MNITLAHALLQERGYSLEMRDEKKHGKPVCRVYATSTTREQFLCNLSRFATTSTETFRSMIERLEVDSDAR